MRIFALVLLALLASSTASADECLVVRADEAAAVIARALKGECRSNAEEYRNRYRDFFPGAQSFQVVRWNRSMQISAELPVLRGSAAEPLLLVTNPDVHVVISGGKTVRVTGRSVILDGIIFKGFSTTALRLEGQEHLVVRSRVLQNRGTGIVIRDSLEPSCKAGPPRRRAFKGVRIFESEISENALGGIDIDAFGVTLDESTVHHNEVFGIRVKTESYLERCRIPEDPIDPLFLKTALITKTNIFANALEISSYPLPSVRNLAFAENVISGLVQLPAKEVSPWNSSTIGLTSLEVELFAEDAVGKRRYLGTAPLDETSGRFFLPIAEPVSNIVAIVISREYGHVSHPSSGEERQLPNDADGDGLPDTREDLNGNGRVDRDLGETDPLNPDTDGDGLTDGEERDHIGRIAALLEKGFPFAALDRLDPNNPDSDGDCLPDGLEVGISRDRALPLIERMPQPPRVEFSPHCLLILEKNGVTSFDESILFNPFDPALSNNISMLIDLDPETTTDPTSDDSDGDGLPDGKEDGNFNGRRDSGRRDQNETDPRLSDSDEDGIIDGLEGDQNNNGKLDKEESDPVKSDTDGDGVLDGDERRVGTHPGACDTDGDGLSDGVELGAIRLPESPGECHGLSPAGTNYQRPEFMDPLNPDSDGDGLNDGEEDRDQNGWIDRDESDPSVPDSDRDGLDDGIEARGDFNGDGIADFDLNLINIGRGCAPPESINDIDCDGIPNNRDDDSDNDGCPDREEGGWRDQNNNGIPDVYDPLAKACSGSRGGGSGGGALPSLADGANGATTNETPSVPLPSWYQPETAGGGCTIIVIRR